MNNWQVRCPVTGRLVTVSYQAYEAVDEQSFLDISAAILAERRQQEQHKLDGRFAHSCAEPLGGKFDFERLAILGEEFGETAHEVNETIGGHRPLNRMKLRKELLQVAAVAVAWLQGLDAEDVNTPMLEPELGR